MSLASYVLKVAALYSPAVFGGRKTSPNGPKNSDATSVSNKNNSPNRSPSINSDTSNANQSFAANHPDTSASTKPDGGKNFFSRLNLALANYLT